MLVFAPLGLVATIAGALPPVIGRGREQLEVQLRNARFVGKLVVTSGREQLRRRAASPVGRSNEHGDSGARGGADPRADLAVKKRGMAPVPFRPAQGSATATATPGPSGGGDAPVGIPGYDTLSASQVVRRLDGLGRNELREIGRYEAQTRGRRTILHRVQQLLGFEQPPGRSTTGS